MIKCGIPFFCECGKDVCCIHCEEKADCSDRCAKVDNKKIFNSLEKCKFAYEEEE